MSSYSASSLSSRRENLPTVGTYFPTTSRRRRARCGPTAAVARVLHVLTCRNGGRGADRVLAKNGKTNGSSRASFHRQPSVSSSLSFRSNDAKRRIRGNGRQLFHKDGGSSCGSFVGNGDFTGTSSLSHSHGDDDDDGNAETSNFYPSLLSRRTRTVE